MSRVICLLALLLLPMQALAVDKYDTYAINSWHAIVRVQPGVTYKSKYVITKKEINKVKRVYRLTKFRFKKFTGVNVNTCYPGDLEIRVISLNDLSDKMYFPREMTYSSEYSLIVGRYFRASNHLYLVPKRHHYDWHKNFAHELLHHFFDECGIKFENDHQEHRVIGKFEREYYGDST